MAIPNRAAKITKLVTALKKKYKPAAVPPKDRPLLEHLLIACLLEDSLHDEAEKALVVLREAYFDWNEVRVSTKRELSELLSCLSNPAAAAERLKDTLQSIFENVYTFDIESMKKQNLGASIKQLEKYRGVSPFVVAYAVQNSLGGHAIPINNGLLIALEVLEIIDSAEAAKHSVPGLERTVPKNKGVEVGSVLHQLGVEIGRNPYGTKARKLLLDLDPSCKSRLPKKPVPPKPEPPKPAKKAAAAKPSKKADAKKADVKKADVKKADKKPAAKTAKAAPKTSASVAKPAPKKKAAAKKKPVANKKVVKKKVVKKTVKKAKHAASKVTAKKKKTAKPVKKKSNLKKKKPR